jgi:hypothetical protein
MPSMGHLRFRLRMLTAGLSVDRLVDMVSLTALAVHRDATHAGTAQQKTAIDWKATWVAPMSVVRCGGDVKINIPAVHDVLLGEMGPIDDLPGGKFDLTVDLDETASGIFEVRSAEGLRASGAAWRRTCPCRRARRRWISLSASSQ